MKNYITIKYGVIATFLGILWGMAFGALVTLTAVGVTIGAHPTNIGILFIFFIPISLVWISLVWLLFAFDFAVKGD